MTSGVMAKVLVADSDLDRADLIAYALRRNGFSVVTAFDGESVVRLWRDQQPDMVLLNMALPKTAGWEVVRRIRFQDAATPIVAFGLEEESDVARALDIGVDDHVGDPLSVRFLVAKLHALLRRQTSSGRYEPPEELEVNGFRLDPRFYRVWCSRGEVNLTRLEFHLLYELVRHQGTPLSAAVLTERVWGYHTGPVCSSVRTHIRHLRQKVEPDPSRPRHILTVKGAGYLFQAEPPWDEEAVPEGERSPATVAGT